jgi:hypothetical protein
VKKFFHFIFVLAVSILAFRGLDAYLHDWFGLCIEGLLTFGGVGVVLIFGFKFHVFCCLIPAAISSFICVKKKHNHEHCNHTGEHEDKE